MKAIRQYEFGGPDTLRYEDVPDPEPGPGQVRVRVLASSVQYTGVLTPTPCALVATCV